MWTLIMKGVAWVLGKLFGPKPGPSQEAVQAANAAESKTVAQTDQATAETQARVAQAEAVAPRTRAEVVDSLNKGEF